MKLAKSCKTCEFNFNGVCAGHGSIYKYGDKIVDDSAICENWSANLEYFTYETKNAPRFLREPLSDCQISHPQFSKLLDAYEAGESIPINIFDAVKVVYGISMIDIAVLMGVSFGVVYRAKTRGVPQKRISSFANTLGLSPNLIIATTTADFDELKKASDAFWNRSNIVEQLKAMPEWKKELSHEISSFYLKCPVHLAQEYSRVDKLYWIPEMPTDELTESEEKMIAYITRNSKKHQPVIRLEYSLDIACKPHMRTTTYNESSNFAGT